jgi:hypothetical protein
MKQWIASVAAGATMLASAQTVILFDDGLQYTLDENEKVYVSNYSKLYQMQTYSKGDVKLTQILPTTKRDYVPVETGAVGAVGSHEWCESYIPWSEGLTFDMITWQKACDTNKDGAYNICDWYEPTGRATFEELEWRDRCNDGKPWDGS